LTTPTLAPAFGVISGRTVQRVLAHRERQIVDLMEATYRQHGSGETVNPPSYFLHFPDRPTARIIALPAAIGVRTSAAGIKWISSYPENPAKGLPRASAVLVLNDTDTGYPKACLEASVISASRTAASAALAAVTLGRDRTSRGRVGFFGAGLIARYIHTYLAALDWPFDEIGVHDTDPARAQGLADRLRATGPDTPVRVHTDPAAFVRAHDVIVFATTAGSPHVTDPALFGHHPLVLHISLRDLSPQVVLGGVNILDDIDHCLTADTSPHLAEKLTGNRDFIAGTLHDVLTADLEVPADQTVIFSPFGLGVLDLALAEFVYAQCLASNGLEVIDGFFSELGG